MSPGAHILKVGSSYTEGWLGAVWELLKTLRHRVQLEKVGHKVPFPVCSYHGPETMRQLIMD